MIRQKALYPSLMINEGFVSRKLKNPKDFENMRNRRLTLKKQKDKRQKPLKIVIALLVTTNSFNIYQWCQFTV